MQQSLVPGLSGSANKSPSTEPLKSGRIQPKGFVLVCCQKAWSFAMSLIVGDTKSVQA